MCQVHLLASTHPLASGFHVINTLPQHGSVDLILTVGRQATVHAMIVMIVNTVFDSSTSPGEVFACWRVAGLLKLSTTANQLGWNLTFDATWNDLRVTFYLWNSTWRCRFCNLLAKDCHRIDLLYLGRSVMDRLTLLNVYWRLGFGDLQCWHAMFF